MRTRRAVLAAILLAASVLAGAASCGSNLEKSDGATRPDGTDVPVTGDTVTPDGTGDSPAELPPGRRGSVRGVVYSPESGSPMIPNFPVSGAMVWVTRTPPPDLAPGAECRPCITLDATVPSAFSAADGTFQVDNVPEGSWILVVQKGEFRRVSYVDVLGETTVNLSREQTTFPSLHAPPNDFTPHMAVALGSYDIMEDIVAKMGLCPLDGEFHWTRTACDHIEFFDNGGANWGESFPDFQTLLMDYNKMKSFHVIFVPCSSSATDAALRNATVKENIRNYVKEGGKWYVADWSYDFVEQVFPEFLDFEGDDFSIGAADEASGEFDSTGRAVDPDLRNWLAAIGEPADGINFQENWDCLQALGNVAGFDDTGAPITITPYTWAEGPVTRSNDCFSGNAPLTLTFPYGCGKVLFTTYHTVGAMGGEGRPNLITQEKILFYLILEIGLCSDPVEVPI